MLYTIVNFESGFSQNYVFSIQNIITLTPRYIDILDNTVIPYIEEFRYEDIYYYQDNGPIHRSRIVTNWFEDNFSPGQLNWSPAKSFDINPIKNCGEDIK